MRNQKRLADNLSVLSIEIANELRECVSLQEYEDMKRVAGRCVELIHRMVTEIEAPSASRFDLVSEARLFLSIVGHLEEPIKELELRAAAMQKRRRK